MRSNFLKQKRFNILRTSLLFLGIALLVLMVSYMLMGVSGLIWVGIILAFTLFMGSQLPVHYIMRFSRARRLHPSEVPFLFDIVKQLAQRAKLERIPQLYYIPSGTINAFATGQRQDAAIAVTHGILQQLTPREITGVIAHEMSHIMNNDVRFQGLIAVMTRMVRFFSFFGLVTLMLNIDQFLMGQALVSFLILSLLILAPYLSNLLMLAISRTREFDADLEAARLTGDPNGLADALQKLDYYSKFSGKAMWQNAIPSWLSTHPALMERVSRLRALNY